MLDSKFNRPKSFGEILDHTFSLIKANFKDFFFVMLIFLGPIYLLQAVIELFSGVSFFRDVEISGGWAETFLDSFESTALSGADTVLVLSGLLSLLITPMAIGTIIIMIEHIRKGKEYDVKSSIKKAFSRYGAIIGASIIFGIMLVFLITIAIFLTTAIAVSVSFDNPFIGIITGLLLFIAAFIGIGLLFTRLSFYFCSVLFQEGTPGFTRSLQLTKGRMWSTFGIYVVFILITFAINKALELSVGLLLGYSVLFSIIINLSLLVTSMITTVGYAVLYFDLKTRHDADDLKDMIDSYD